VGVSVLSHSHLIVGEDQPPANVGPPSRADSRSAQPKSPR